MISLTILNRHQRHIMTPGDGSRDSDSQSNPACRLHGNGGINAPAALVNSSVYDGTPWGVEESWDSPRRPLPRLERQHGLHGPEMVLGAELEDA